MVIHGPSGSGKTTLIAHVLTSSISQQAQEIVARFVGATASSSNPRLLLRDLCLLLAELEAESGYSVPERLGDLVTDFRRLLVAWPTDRTLLLIIDALAEEAWAWLNDELPASVHLLVSVLDGSDLDLIGRLAPRSELLDVGRMRTGDAGKALDAWLAAASPSRTLQPSQRNAVLEAFDHTGLPLHLRLLYEQARRWTSDHRPGELPSSVEATIDRLFDTLSEPTEHGPVVVGAALSYLAAARDGLTSTEFVDVLSLDAETMQDFRARQPLDSPSTDILPAIVWTRLLFDLDAYLTERDRLGTPTLDFFHRQFRDVVVRRWLAASSGNLVHSRLAAYFAGLDTWLRNGVAAVPNRRKLAELPYQYTEAGQWVAAEALLTDPDVLRALVEGLGPGELVDDLDRILEPSRLPEVEAQLGGVKHLRALRRAASASSPIVSADPSQLPSQLCGRIGTEYESLRHRLRGWKGQAWLEPLRPTLEAGALRFVLSGHRGSVRSVAVSKDSRWCATAGNSTPDRTIRVWSLERGTQLRVLEDLAEAGKETPLAFDSTGALLVGRGQELFVVDVLVGRIERALVTDGDHVACLAAAANVPVAVAGAGRMLYVCLPGLGDEAKLIDVGNAVAKVAVTHDGRQVAALTAKGVLLFDLDELSELARCEREIDVGTGFWDRPPLALSPTGDTVSFGRDLLRWHPATGEVEEVIASAQADSMDAPRAVLAITPDGKQALVSPSSDDMRDRALSSDQSCSIAAWSPGPGPAGPAIKGPGAQISATAITSDGEVAVVAYYDHSVRVWELQRATDSSLSAHDNPVRSIVVDGELAVTIDQGNIVLFWSLSTGQPVDQRETRFSEQSLDDLIALFERTEAQLDVLDPPGSRFSAYRWVISAGGRRAVRYAVSTAKLSEEPDPADLSDREGQPMPFDVWDLDLEGRPVERRHEGRGELDSRLNRVVVSPDGRKAIAAGWGSLRVFDLELGRQLFRLIGHTGPVWDVALAGGGQLAMSAAEDATVRLWDIETGLSASRPSPAIARCASARQPYWPATRPPRASPVRTPVGFTSCACDRPICRQDADLATNRLPPHMRRGTLTSDLHASTAARSNSCSMRRATSWSALSAAASSSRASGSAGS